jgi:hypothetical protein
VDIILQTNTDNPSFAFRNFARFNDGSGYGAKLSIRSGWISIEYDLHIEVHPFTEFLRKLRLLDHSLNGVARLKPTYEPQFIEFLSVGRGHILVKGDLMEHGGFGQRVQFSFQTDQTCLPPLIAALQQFAS